MPQRHRASVENEGWLVAAAAGRTPAILPMTRFWELPPTVDAGLLGAGVEALAAAHDVLTSRFVLVEADERALFEPGYHDVRMAVSDVPVTRGTTPGQALLTAARALASEPVDPLEDPLFQVTLLRAGDERLLAVKASHIALDGWGEVLLCRGLGRRYAALAQGEDGGGGGQAPQMGWWAAEHRAFLDRPEAESMVASWRDRCRRHRPWRTPDLSRSGGDAGGERFAFQASLSPQLSARVSAIAAAYSSTPYPLLLRAFGRAWGRLTGLDEFAIRVPHANRLMPGSEEVVGCLASQVPFATSTDALAPVPGGVRNTQFQLLECMEAGIIPMNHIVQALPDGDAAALTSPLTPMFNQVAGVGPRLRLGDADCREVPVEGSHRIAPEFATVVVDVSSRPWGMTMVVRGDVPGVDSLRGIVALLEDEVMAEPDPAHSPGPRTG